MNDLDDLIAEAREQAAYLRGVSRDGSMPYSGELLGSLADALEARQPTEDDREVAMSAAREGLMSSYTDHWPDIQAQIVDSILAAGFSRAAVPDAATEEKFKKAEAFDKAVALSERRQTLLEEAEAERDAALARIAEAAKLHRNAGPSQGYDSRFTGGYGMLGDCCATCGSHGEYGVEWPCPTAVSLGLNEGENEK